MENLKFHNEFLPSFGLGEDQRPVCLLTVLKPGMSGRDCAAYRGVIPASAMKTEDSRQDIVKSVCSLGDKISEKAARELFDLGDLTYRR